MVAFHPLEIMPSLAELRRRLTTTLDDPLIALSLLVEPGRSARSPSISLMSIRITQLPGVQFEQ